MTRAAGGWHVIKSEIKVEEENKGARINERGGGVGGGKSLKSHI